MGEEVRNKPPNPLKRAVEDKDNAVSFIDDSDEDDDSDSDDSDFNVSYQNKRRAYKVILNGKPEPVWIVEMTDTRSETVGWWLTRADFQIRYQRGDLLIPPGDRNVSSTFLHTILNFWAKAQNTCESCFATFPEFYFHVSRSKP